MTDETIAELTRRRGSEEETAVRKILQELCHSLESAYATPDAVFIPTKTGYTEIDALLICPAGIFVFECKHMTGTVLGKPTDRMWTKTGETVLSFPNPLLQNKRHADAAAIWFGIPRQYCFSYTVFNDSCILTDPDSSKQIFRTDSLPASLKPLITKSNLSLKELERTIAKAEKLSSDDKTRQKHTAQINATKKEKRLEKKRRS